MLLILVSACQTTSQHEVVDLDDIDFPQMRSDIETVSKLTSFKGQLKLESNCIYFYGRNVYNNRISKHVVIWPDGSYPEKIEGKIRIVFDTPSQKEINGPSAASLNKALVLNGGASKTTFDPAGFHLVPSQKTNCSGAYIIGPNSWYSP